MEYIHPIHKEKKLLSDLYNKLYMVAVPKITLYTDEEIRVLGIPTTIKNGRPDIKSNLDMTKVMIPLKQIMEIYHNGFTIRVINRDDIYKIANDIDEILELLKYSINTYNSDVKDKLKQFLDGILKINDVVIDEKINEKLQKSKEVYGDDLFMDINKPKIDISKLEV